MCYFCKDCNKTLDEFQNHCETSWNEYTTIVKDSNCYKLYVPYFDSYYSGTAIEIKFCPVCGRELGE